eukprot:558203-Pleurochrysis_carterae.AAC.1
MIEEHYMQIETKICAAEQRRDLHGCWRCHSNKVKNAECETNEARAAALRLAAHQAQFCRTARFVRRVSSALFFSELKSEPASLKDALLRVPPYPLLLDPMALSFQRVVSFSRLADSFDQRLVHALPLLLTPVASCLDLFAAGVTCAAVMPLSSLLPIGIMVGALTTAGLLLPLVHYAFHGEVHADLTAIATLSRQSHAGVLPIPLLFLSALFHLALRARPANGVEIAASSLANSLSLSRCSLLAGFSATSLALTRAPARAPLSSLNAVLSLVLLSHCASLACLFHPHSISPVASL